MLNGADVMERISTDSQPLSDESLISIEEEKTYKEKNVIEENVQEGKLHIE